MVRAVIQAQGQLLTSKQKLWRRWSSRVQGTVPKETLEFYLLEQHGAEWGSPWLHQDWGGAERVNALGSTHMHAWALKLTD